MDFRAVLIFLCLHIAQASCKSLSSGVVDDTIQMIRGEIRKALDELAAPQLLPNVSCGSLNATELLGLEQQQRLPSIRCYLVEIFKLLPELLTLEKAIQYTGDVELFTNGATVTKNCSLPSFDQHLDGFVYAKCLLEILHDRLGKAVLNH